MNARPGLVVDLFAGGGGASTGLEAALRRPVDVAINHNEVALAVHAANHPDTRHIQTDIFDVRPRVATKGRPVDVLWASPSCTHFSRSRGGKPVNKQERSLAWVVTSWANDVRPRLIFVENVPEFQTWGPVDRGGVLVAEKKGKYFRQWVRRLEKLGYAVEARVLDASQYGAPTRRKRLFIVARCDGLPVSWPNPTHGEVGDLFTQPYRTAAECIDWTLPCPSIFEPGRDLVPNSLKRIAEGIRRFVLEDPNPFVVELDGRPAVPMLVQRGFGERPGQAPRCMDIRKPLGTVVAGGQKHALVAAFLASNFGGEVGIPLTRPMRTITTRDHPEQVAAFLASYYGQGVGQSLRAPMRTSTTKDRFALVTVHGTQQRIADIGYRMLEPHELLKAQFGDYAEGYDLSPATSKSAKVKLIGNSVAPAAAAALVRANVRRPVVAEVARG